MNSEEINQQLDSILEKTNGSAIVVIKEAADEVKGLEDQREALRNIHRASDINKILITEDSALQAELDDYINTGNFSLTLTEYLSESTNRRGGEQRYNHLLKIIDYAKDNNIPIEFVSNDKYFRNLDTEVEKIKESLGENPDGVNVVLDNDINSELQGGSNLSERISQEFQGKTMTLTEGGVSTESEVYTAPRPQSQSASQSEQPASTTPPEGQQVPEQNLLIKISTVNNMPFDRESASENARQVYDNFYNTGFIEHDEETINKFKEEIPYLPEGKENEVINAAEYLFVNGVEDERLENAINQAGELNEFESNFLNSVRQVNRMLYAVAPDTGDELRRASNFQDIEILRTDQIVPPQLNIIVNQAQDVVIGKLKEKGQDALKKIGAKGIKVASKARKQLVGKAAKFGAKLLGKEGTKALLSLLGGPAEPLVWLALELLDAIRGILKKVFSKIIPEFIRKNKKALAAAGLALMGGGALVGSGIAVAVGGLVLVSASGSIAAAGSTFLAFITGFIGVVMAASAGFFTALIMAVLGTFFLFAAILYIMTVGAYVVPYTDISLTTGIANQPGNIAESAYMDVTKTASPDGGFENTDLDSDVDGDGQPGRTITYNISIQSLTGTLSVKNIEYTCSTRKEGTRPDCPPTQPDPPFSDITFPFNVNEGEPWNYTYTQVFSGRDYEDTGIRDIVTVTADADEQANTTESAYAYVTFGNPPDDCPEGWPIRAADGSEQLYIVQGPEGSTSHSGLEAMDVILDVGYPITARHSGIVTTSDTGSRGYGKLVIVSGICEGNSIRSYYAHMSAIEVSDGQEVSAEELVGYTGDTGYGVCGDGSVCALPHIHYEFRGLRMDEPWIPQSIPYGCTTISSCNVEILP